MKYLLLIFLSSCQASSPGIDLIGVFAPMDGMIIESLIQRVCKADPSQVDHFAAIKTPSGWRWRVTGQPFEPVDDGKITIRHGEAPR